MPIQIENVRGQKVTIYSKEDVDYYVEVYQRSRQSFEPSPLWVMGLFQWELPYFVFVTPFTQNFWEKNFTPPAQQTWKPAFIEIYTDSQGVLTSQEVVAEVARSRTLGVELKMDASLAARAYNNELDQTHRIYGEDLSMDEIAEQLDLETYARLEVVHTAMSEMLDAEPIYYSIDTPKVISEDLVMIEGISHYTVRDVSKVPTIGIAFPGVKALKRDLFNSGIGENPDRGRDSMRWPGRDRWFRLTGIRTFDVYLYSPILVLTAIQVSQLSEGRPVGFKLSPILPPGLLRPGA